MPLNDLFKSLGLLSPSPASGHARVLIFCACSYLEDPPLRSVRPLFLV